MIEHLADGLTDRMKRAATAWAGLMFDIEMNVLAGQVRWEARPLTLCLRRLGLCCGKQGPLRRAQGRC